MKSRMIESGASSKPQSVSTVGRLGTCSCVQVHRAIARIEKKFTELETTKRPESKWEESYAWVESTEQPRNVGCGKTPIPKCWLW